MRAALMLTAGLLTLPIPASATLPVPSPTESTLPACVVACPAGDMHVQVIVREFFGTVLANSYVVLRWTSCSSFDLCLDCADSYAIDSATEVRNITNAIGVADFYLCAVGSCVDAVTVLADGVTLTATPLSYASADQNGDLTVDPADVAAVQAKVGTGDLSGDLDCSGDVTAADVDIVTTHLGHTCEVATPVAPRTWGRVKLLYR